MPAQCTELPKRPLTTQEKHQAAVQSRLLGLPTSAAGQLPTTAAAQAVEPSHAANAPGYMLCGHIASQPACPAPGNRNLLGCTCTAKHFKGSCTAASVAQRRRSQGGAKAINAAACAGLLHSSSTSQVPRQIRGSQRRLAATQAPPSFRSTSKAYQPNRWAPAVTLQWPAAGLQRPR